MTRRGRRLIPTAAAVAIVIPLGAPAGAAAAARYASPGGSSSNPCTEVEPCDIETAISGAGAGDDITIEPGSYAPTVPLDDQGNQLTIHGRAGQLRPVIASTALAAFHLTGANTSLSAVQIEMSSGSQQGIAATRGTIDRVIVHVPGSPATACAVQSETVTNSTCRASGPGGSRALAATSMVFPETLTLRNDTLVATGEGGVGAQMTAHTGGALTVTLSNSIVRGTGHDIQTNTNSSTDAITLTADHSNYADVFKQGFADRASVTPPGSSDNQTAAPQFIDAAAGNLHESASSPTVDAGATAPVNGPFDLDGIPRQLGASTDMGAYEFIPPPACQPASATTPFGQPVAIQLSCADVLGAPVGFAIASTPLHGTVSLDAVTGQAAYTPAAGYSGQDSFTFAGTSSHGTGAPATASITVGAGPPPADLQPPALSNVSMLRSRFAVGARPTAKVAVGKGTAFRFTLSESAAVRITFARLLPGRKVGRACKPPRRDLRRRPRCTRRVAAGSLLRRNLSAGRHSVAFTGRVGSKALAPGRYSATLVATDPAKNTGKPRTLRFTIVRPTAGAAIARSAAAPRAPKAAIVAAFERAVYHYPSPEKIRVAVSLRSVRDRDWSLVTGQYGRRGLWAAWVRRTASGRQRVEIFRTRNFDPGSRPPCDIRPAFSEPACVS